MPKNDEFQQQGLPQSSELQRVEAPLTRQQALVQSVSPETMRAPLSPNTVMVGCLSPFCIAFVLFSIYLIRHRRRLNRGLKRLQHITILERALERTPDECS